MKNLITGAMLSLALLLSGCAGLDGRSGAKYLLAAAEVSGSFEPAKERHDRLVPALTEHKDKFSDEEREVLKVQLRRMEEVRAELEVVRNTNGAEQILAGSALLDNYAKLRDAYEISMDIVVGHVDEFPLQLALDVKAQVRDVVRLDAAMKILLSKPDGTDYSGAVNSVLKILGAVSRIAVAVA